jgi:transposase
MTHQESALLPRSEMEHRRLEAAEQFLKGSRPSVIARRYGVSSTTVYRWRRTLQARGIEGLKRRHTPGRPRRLTPSQLDELRAVLRQERYTAIRFTRVIQEKYGVSYDPDHVGRLMHVLRGERRIINRRPS